MQERGSLGQREMNPRTIEPEETKVIIIRSLEEIQALENPNEVKMVHLSRQEAAKTDTIKELLETCPNLITVSAVPSIAEGVLSLEAKKLLAGKDIELQIKRLRNVAYYDCRPPTARRNYLAKKEIYEDVLENPEKKEERQLLFLLNKYGFDATEMVKMYFGEEAMSIRDIAKKTGIKYFNVYKDIATLLHLIGYPSSDQNVLRRSRRWLRKLNKKAEREYYQVGKTKPPRTLPRSRWGMWQKIMEFRKDKPHTWAYIKKNSSRQYEILVKFFQLGEFRGEIITLEQIAKEHKVTGQRISYLKKTILDYLISLE